MITFQRINMTYTTFEDVDLEDIEKKKGLVSFTPSDYDAIKLEISEIKPVLKKQPVETIIIDGKQQRKRRTKPGLF